MALVVRSLWQIAVIPTAYTMLLFIPFIVTLLGSNVFLAFLIISPGKLAGLPYKTGITLILTAGLLAGVTHFVRFIISPVADPVLSKVIGILVLLFGLNAFCIILWLVWSLREAGDKQGR